MVEAHATAIKWRGYCWAIMWQGVNCPVTFRPRGTLSVTKLTLMTDKVSQVWNISLHFIPCYMIAQQCPYSGLQCTWDMARIKHTHKYVYTLYCIYMYQFILFNMQFSFGKGIHYPCMQIRTYLPRLNVYGHLHACLWLYSIAMLCIYIL